MDDGEHKIMDTMLQIEGIARAPLNHQVEEERLRVIEKQQEIVTRILHKLTNKPTSDELQMILQQILDLDDGSAYNYEMDDDAISFSYEIYSILKQKIYLSQICRGLESDSYRCVQLVTCVLTKFLNFCRGDDELVLFTRTLFIDLEFYVKTKVVFSQLLYECSQYKSADFSEIANNSGYFAEHSSTLDVYLNLLLCLLDKLIYLQKNEELLEYTLQFMQLAVDCLMVCTHEEDVVLYAIQLINILLRSHPQAWQTFIHGKYRIFLDILSGQPYEGLF